MKLASRSAMESLNSANCGSRASSAVATPVPLLCELRSDDLDEGRNGVVGREIGDRERVRPGARLCDVERTCAISFENATGMVTKLAMLSQRSG